DGVTLLRGQARFLDRDRVVVDGRELTAPHILIATGGKSVWPTDIPGAALGMDSDGFFALQAQPQRLVVVGSGCIAVELAGLMNALGSEVHLLLRRKAMLREFDLMLGEHLMACMQADGVHIHTETQVERLDESGAGIRVTLQGGKG